MIALSLVEGFSKEAKGLRSRVTVHRSGGAHSGHRWDLKLKDKVIGSMHMKPGQENQVSLVSIDPKYRGMGLGKKFYGEVSRRMPGRTLKSDTLVSEDAQRVWRGMGSRGYKVKENVMSSDIAGWLRDPSTMKKTDVRYHHGEFNRPMFKASLPAKAAIGESARKHVTPGFSFGYTDPAKAQHLKKMYRVGKAGLSLGAAGGLAAAARHIGKKSKPGDDQAQRITRSDLRSGLYTGAGEASPLGFMGAMGAGALSAKKGRRQTTASGGFLGSVLGAGTGATAGRLAGGRNKDLAKHVGGHVGATLGAIAGGTLGHNQARRQQRWAAAKKKKLLKAVPAS